MLWSAAIQAHPSRRIHAEATAELLDAPIVWSQTPGDVWDTHRRARLACDPSADFNVVVQDDVILGDGFHDRLDALLGQHGDRYAYCLFYRHKRGGRLNEAARTAWETDSGGFAFPKLQWCQATVFPSRLIPEMLAWCDALDERPDRDDTRLNRYLKHVGMETFYPLPSLVDHLPEEGSLIGLGANAGRRAWRFE